MDVDAEFEWTRNLSRRTDTFSEEIFMTDSPGIEL